MKTLDSCGIAPSPFPFPYNVRRQLSLRLKQLLAIIEICEEIEGSPVINLNRRDAEQSNSASRVRYTPPHALTALGDTLDHNFFCACSGTLMVNPVVASDGVSYEKSLLIQYINAASASNCSIHLNPQVMVPNRSLQSLIAVNVARAKDVLSRPQF
jgi:hypothetical protein